MESKRSRVARVLDGWGVPRLVLWARMHLPPLWLTAITYHRITPPAASLSDPGVFDTRSDELLWQLSFLRSHFSAIGVEEIVAWRDEGRALPRNPVVITFDDAYVDNYTHVMPLLQSFRLKAVFCVPTQAVGERRVSWWDRIAHVVHASPRDRVAIEYPEAAKFGLDGDRSAVVARLIETVKVRISLDLDRFLDELSKACGVPWDAATDRGLADRLLMTWDQVRELHRAGMCIASHTYSHRVLPTLPPEALEQELVGSREEIERHIGEPVQGIAYPAGLGVAGRPALRAAVAAAGYRIGFAGRGPANLLFGAMDPLDIRRTTVERDLSQSFFRGMLAIPALEHPPGVRRLIG